MSQYEDENYGNFECPVCCYATNSQKLFAKHVAEGHADAPEAHVRYFVMLIHPKTKMPVLIRMDRPCSIQEKRPKRLRRLARRAVHGGSRSTSGRTRCPLLDT